MAKSGKDLAKDLAEDLEETQAGLLADEDGYDRRTPWRLAFWGLGAVGAVTIAVLANQSYVHNRQDRAAIVDLMRRSEQVQIIARESRNDIRRLSAAVDTLNGDRDRLFARATALEQGLESVADSIARQSATLSSLTAPSSHSQQPPPSAPEAKSEAADTAPDVTASIAAAPEVAVPRTTFAVDLGPANSIDGLRSLWRRMTAAHRTALADLQPAIALRERKPPAGVQLRLIAGPLDNAARAAEICAAVATGHQTCTTTTFEGQKLAMDVEPAAASPPPPRRPNTAPHAARAKPAAAPAARPSTAPPQ